MSEPAAEDDSARLEAGRRLFARPWDFIAAASSVDNLPSPAGIEVAFAGRSNVGKSSLINALTGRKALARTSSTPGRTRQLNLFGAGTGVVLVDMPGYGYAAAPKKEVAAWSGLSFAYLRGRANLRRVYVLIDARHGLKPNDTDALGVLDKAAVSYQIVLTKADKLKGDELAATIATVGAAIVRRPAAHPAVIATSAETGLGLDALRAEIAAFGNSE